MLLRMTHWVCVQLETYCRVRKVRFFALSTYQYTWLCYARDGCIHVSRGLAWDSRHPTVPQVRAAHVVDARLQGC